MIFTFEEERPSDSSFADTVWRTSGVRAGTFTSIASSQWEMVLMRHRGQTVFTIRGPETKPTVMQVGSDFEDAEWFGITFKVGTFMPHLPPRKVMNLRDVNLPEAASTSFWLYGSAWQFPDYENADTFVDRLVRDGLLVREPVVDAALQGHLPDVSLRSVQRRFLRATGLSHATVFQIERARQAVELLEQGASILDTVYELGYADQPHMTRALRRFIGYTPAQVADGISRSR